MSLYHEPNNDLQALLCLKLHLSDPSGRLSSWNNSIQFCSWLGVTCSKRHPSRVVALNLGSLDLNGQIPPCISNLTFLTRIHMPNNQLSGQIPAELGQLRKLQYLNLRSNNIGGIIPNTLASCFNLQIIDMSSLTYLGLRVNSLGGEIPNDIGYTLPRISTLIMQGNQLRGGIPTSLANSTNLQVIDLRQNAFSGLIPSFGTLPDLIELNLGKNRLEAGDWSFLSSLTNCSQLQKLYLDGNILDGALPSSIEGLSKSLEVLLLNANKISGSIPSGIKNLRNLKLFHMEQNLLSGNLPHSLGELPNLFVLSLSQNRLCGSIPPSFEDNNLSGSIPQALGNCKNLEMLNLSCNNFNGSIPKQLFTLSTLSEGLDLSHNQLSGQIPQEIGGLINLSLLNISSNKLIGQIPSSIGECVHLESLHMERNLLDGRIPESFITLRGIIEIDLSQNNLSGKIPEFFDSFTSIMCLNLSFNDLEGPVPTSGIFQNAREVFIQVFKLDQLGAPKSFIAECEVLRNTRHRNLVKVITACSTFNPTGRLVGPRGSIGYIAPEYGYGRKISREGDIYSYGIIILELLTGKRPTDEMFNVSLSLHKFILDPNIIPNLEDNDMSNSLEHENHATVRMMSNIMRIAKLGLSCSVETPKDSPTMQDVYAEVIAIKEDLCN
ncbi:hypothetical protein HU200_040637 [Digitaria exilis]|uniref:non-specific serine/threonine protein kinase n=1 Tax=Digitaria exilis TaxID=1010633 RepID=A0A835B9G4_9POAL|nr:hypothetical protein HU200_040637 [Digitaria exilis]